MKKFLTFAGIIVILFVVVLYILTGFSITDTSQNKTLEPSYGDFKMISNSGKGYISTGETKFIGTTTISGIYIDFGNTVKLSGSNELCFKTDENSSKKLPYGADFFCFDDFKSAKQLLRINSVEEAVISGDKKGIDVCNIYGKATLTIKDFIVSHSTMVDAEFLTKSTLVSVESFEKPKPFICTDYWSEIPKID